MFAVRSVSVVPLLPLMLAQSLAHAQTIKADAQAYSGRPIRLIVPYSPGGASDNIARIVMPRLGEALKQSIVIRSRRSMRAGVRWCARPASSPE